MICSVEHIWPSQPLSTLTFGTNTSRPFADQTLPSGTWTHDYPIIYERANALGLRVQKEMPESVLHLMQLYPQPTRKQSAVEYLPFRIGLGAPVRGRLRVSDS